MPPDKNTLTSVFTKYKAQPFTDSSDIWYTEERCEKLARHSLIVSESIAKKVIVTSELGNILRLRRTGVADIVCS